MGEVTNEQVNLMLRLYEDRREPRLREAREWFSANFHVVIMSGGRPVAPVSSMQRSMSAISTAYLYVAVKPPRSRSWMSRSARRSAV